MLGTDGTGGGGFGVPAAEPEQHRPRFRAWIPWISAQAVGVLGFTVGEEQRAFPLYLKPIFPVVLKDPMRGWHIPKAALGKRADKD